jgi:hypothetical protein
LPNEIDMSTTGLIENERVLVKDSLSYFMSPGVSMDRRIAYSI